jgi:hypothetical protein
MAMTDRARPATGASRVYVADGDIQPIGELTPLHPGKSNRAASIIVVNSIDTFSTQSKIALRGRGIEHGAAAKRARWRM